MRRDGRSRCCHGLALDTPQMSKSLEERATASPELDRSEEARDATRGPTAIAEAVRPTLGDAGYAAMPRPHCSPPPRRSQRPCTPRRGSRGSHRGWDSSRLCSAPHRALDATVDSGSSSPVSSSPLSSSSCSLWIPTRGSRGVPGHDHPAGLGARARYRLDASWNRARAWSSLTRSALARPNRLPDPRCCDAEASIARSVVPTATPGGTC